MSQPDTGKSEGGQAVPSCFPAGSQRTEVASPVGAACPAMGISEDLTQSKAETTAMQKSRLRTDRRQKRRAKEPSEGERMPGAEDGFSTTTKKASKTAVPSGWPGGAVEQDTGPVQEDSRAAIPLRPDASSTIASKKALGDNATVQQPMPDAPSVGSATASDATHSMFKKRPSSLPSAPAPSPDPDGSAALLKMSPGGKKQESLKAMNALLKARSEQSEGTVGSSRLIRSLTLQARVFPTTLVLAILIGVTVLFLLLYPGVPGRAETRCETRSCRFHRDLIEDQLDLTVDPCEDFGAHVCGKWRERKHSISSSALEDMSALWLNRFPTLLRDGVAHLPAGRRAVAMFNICMTQTGSQVDVFKNFMRARGPVWPEEREYSGSAVDVMLDLAFNWSVNLWFTMKVLQSTPAHPKRRIFFSHNNRMTVWRTLFKSIPPQKFNTLYEGLFGLFSDNASNYPGKDEMAETYDMLDYVFDHLIHSRVSKVRVPGQFALRDFTKHSKIADPEHLRRALNSVLTIVPPIASDDLVLFSDLALLTSVTHIFNKFGERGVCRHLAWLFVWTYGVMANPAAALLLMRGDQFRAENTRPRYCATQVEANYKLLVASMSIAAYFSAEIRVFINEHLAGIVETAMKKTSSASWLDNQTISIAVEKLKNVGTVLWPTEKYLTEEGIREAYANFSESAPSFASLWIEARRSVRGLFGSEAGIQEQRLPLISTLPFIEYVPVLNALSLSLGALAPPLFYVDGTNAMFHGGLGYFYARELVGAVDREGVKVDPLGYIVSSWLSEAVRPSFQQRERGCLSNNASVFPEVPAIEVAFAAFQHRANKSNLHLSDKLSEVKVFFITACLASCAKSTKHNLYGGDCNKAMMNFAPFAEAFQCPTGSKMNPAKKCTFFD